MKRLFFSIAIAFIAGIGLAIPTLGTGQSSKEPVKAASAKEAATSSRDRILVNRTAATMDLLGSTRITLNIVDGSSLAEGLESILLPLGLEARFIGEEMAGQVLSEIAGVMDAAQAMQLVCTSVGARYEVVANTLIIADSFSGEGVPKVTITYDVVSILETLARRQAMIDRAARPNSKPDPLSEEREDEGMEPHAFLDNMLSTLLIENSDGVTNFSLSGYGGVLVLRATPAMHVFCGDVLKDLRSTIGLDR